MMQQAGAHLARQSQELQDAVQMRNRFTEEQVTAERTFSQALNGLANASEENRVLKEFVRTLEEHCANLAQDNRRVESVAAEFYEEARRVHGLLPSLHSELHGLISVRGALCGDLEHRVNQLRDCESEVERLRSRTGGGGVPAHVYEGSTRQRARHLTSSLIQVRNGSTTWMPCLPKRS